jgi:hypothetical protein
MFAIGDKEEEDLEWYDATTHWSIPSVSFCWKARRIASDRDAMSVVDDDEEEDGAVVDGEDRFLEQGLLRPTTHDCCRCQSNGTDIRLTAPLVVAAEVLIGMPKP